VGPSIIDVFLAPTRALDAYNRRPYTPYTAQFAGSPRRLRNGLKKQVSLLSSSKGDHFSGLAGLTCGFSGLAGEDLLQPPAPLPRRRPQHPLRGLHFWCVVLNFLHFWCVFDCIQRCLGSSSKGDHIFTLAFAFAGKQTAPSLQCSPALGHSAGPLVDPKRASSFVGEHGVQEVQIEAAFRQ
jgi:hypothetical protein